MSPDKHGFVYNYFIFKGGRCGFVVNGKSYIICPNICWNWCVCNIKEIAYQIVLNNCT